MTWNCGDKIPCMSEPVMIPEVFSKKRLIIEFPDLW
eukprot:CAMPEP_0170565900 /NCGR_PEP_ID=MMETSP0211-20121228/79482_1 /TAXON_ID=311385 /ORGANISM="Pseudokeronopsis sp., Strain OXSARD2" /LENGTH=35 /DNA_ID= /DNA_START= /DNA_END= /DNA_ORIENTATION=